MAGFHTCIVTPVSAGLGPQSDMSGGSVGVAQDRSPELTAGWVEPGGRLLQQKCGHTEDCTRVTA